jgi:hypothetical protein
MSKHLQPLRAWFWLRRWPLALALLPFAYVAAVTLPHPFGLGLQHGNDFQGHRIWWTELATWYLKQGQVPMWTPSLDFGTLYFGQRGHAFFYPAGWWTHVFHAPMIPAWQTWTHYLQICLHMSIAMLGVYRLLRTRGGVGEPAAFLGAALLLVNQRFHDSVRYPNAVETMAWIPWILLFAIRVAENTARDPVEQRRRTNDALKLALVTAMSWLAGYGQLTYIAALLVVIVTLSAARSVRGVFLAAASAAAGSLLAAGTLVPTAWMAALAPHRSGDNFAFAIQYPRLGSYLSMFSHPFAEDVHASLFFPPVFLGLIALGAVRRLEASGAPPFRRAVAGGAGHPGSRARDRRLVVPRRVRPPAHVQSLPRSGPEQLDRPARPVLVRRAGRRPPARRRCKGEADWNDRPGTGRRGHRVAPPGRSAAPARRHHARGDLGNVVVADDLLLLDASGRHHPAPAGSLDPPDPGGPAGGDDRADLEPGVFLRSIFHLVPARRHPAKFIPAFHPGSWLLFAGARAWSPTVWSRRIPWRRCWSCRRA